MSNVRAVTVAMAILVTALLYAASGELSAQAADTALRGVVSSQEEGNMEGVVVSARRGGANFTVSVVSDAQDRFWFAEYTGDRIGVFDTRTQEIQEWALPHRYTTPYTVTRPDKNGYVYASSNMSERLARLDPRTGEVIEYQMPTDFDSKKIAHDPTTDGSTLWMSNTRNARVVRVEPLD